MLAHIIDRGGVFPRKWHSGEEKMKEEGSKNPSNVFILSRAMI
jgi:hypothetical protein